MKLEVGKHRLPISEFRSLLFRRIVSEGSLERMLPAPVRAAVIHGVREGEEALEATAISVSAVLHRMYDGGEPFEITALLGSESVTLEERYDPFQQILPIPYHVHEGSIFGPSVVRLYVTAPETLDQSIEYRATRVPLAHVEFGDDFKAAPHAGILIDSHMEAAFTIHESRNVAGVERFAVRPSLLVVCTPHVVTRMVTRSGRFSNPLLSCSRMTEFPANSRIYRQLGRIILLDETNS